MAHFNVAALTLFETCKGFQGMTTWRAALKQEPFAGCDEKKDRNPNGPSGDWPRWSLCSTIFWSKTPTSRATFPRLSKRGYLGVDVFFVLRGFVMAPAQLRGVFQERHRNFGQLQEGQKYGPKLSPLPSPHLTAISWLLWDRTADGVHDRRHRGFVLLVAKASPGDKRATIRQFGGRR